MKTTKLCLQIPAIALSLSLGAFTLVAQDNRDPANAVDSTPNGASTTTTPGSAHPADQVDRTDPTATQRGMHRNLVAVLQPTEGNEARGVVVFEADGNEGVRVTINITGLEPNSKHGIHIHEFGDVSSPDGKSAGSHFNPTGKEHGLPDQGDHHAGDFGNLDADGQGNAKKSLTMANLSLAGDTNSIIGRAVIVHAGEDKGTPPDGAAGARIAQGVIAVANPMKVQEHGGREASDRDATGTENDRPKSETDDKNKGADNATGSRPISSPPQDRGIAEEIGRGAEKAARTTVKVIERGAEEVGDALQDVGREVEKAIK